MGVRERDLLSSLRSHVTPVCVLVVSDIDVLKSSDWPVVDILFSTFNPAISFKGSPFRIVRLALLRPAPALAFSVAVGFGLSLPGRVSRAGEEGRVGYLWVFIPFTDQRVSVPRSL